MYTLTVNTDNPQELADLLSALTGSPKVPVKSSAKVVATSSDATPGENAEISSPEPPKITKEMVRELTAEKVQAGKSAVVKDLLKKYNAKNAATVPEESFASFYNDLKAA